VEVRVVSNGETSDPVYVNLDSVSPGLFTLDGKYVATITGDNALLSQGPSFLAGIDCQVKVRPGETITLYGTGFGTTDPAATPGVLPESALPVTAPILVTIGDLEAKVESVALAPGLGWLYELKAVAPGNLADGDHPVMIQVNGVNSPRGEACCFVPVQTPQ